MATVIIQKCLKSKKHEFFENRAKARLFTFIKMPELGLKNAGFGSENAGFGLENANFGPKLSIFNRKIATFGSKMPMFDLRMPIFDLEKANLCMLGLILSLLDRLQA